MTAGQKAEARSEGSDDADEATDADDACMCTTIDHDIISQSS